jgi:hypothetical protein
MSDPTRQPCTESIALIDLDGTVADYEGQMLKDLEFIRGPNEPVITNIWEHHEHVGRRIDLIKNSPNWWSDLPVIPTGMQVVEIMRELEWEMLVLTKGPKNTKQAWTQKVEWAAQHIPDAYPIITGGRRDDESGGKSLVYGKVLFDDFPKYMGAWLEAHPRGLGIMPVNLGNQDYHHPNLVKYDGTNLDEVRRALIIAQARRPMEPLVL